MFFNIPAANWYNFIIGGAVAAQLTAGQLSLQAATSNWLTLGSFGTGPPAFTTRSVGTKVILFSAITGSTADVAIGVDANTMWSSVRTTADQFRWYGGTTVAATLSGVGALSLTSGIGAFGTAAVTTKPTVSGAKGSNAALASLMTALAAYGLVTDSTTA
jgi:hypothetical protein